MAQAAGHQFAGDQGAGYPVAGDPGGPAPTDVRKFRVFISYSRDDLDFADQLVTALELVGFDPTIDRHGIGGGEAWQSRLGALILESDTVVFVVSPSSARSEICGWEVDEAFRLGKRILPVVAKPLAGVAPPQKLQDLNYVFFYPEPRSPGSGFGSGLSKLVAALNSDLGWIREHTRLLERATEWDLGGRPVSRLLSGSDIVHAKAWAGQRPKDAPEPTTRHLDYIRASEQEEASRANAERQRLDEMAAAQAERANALRDREQALAESREVQRNRNRLAIIFSLAMTAVAALAGYQWQEAVKQGKLARIQTVEAEKQKAEAELRRVEAETQKTKAEQFLYEAQLNRARSLVEKAKDEIAAGRVWRGILVTIEALELGKAVKDRYFWLPAANQILALQWLNRPLGHNDKVVSVSMSANGNAVVTGSIDKNAYLWDAKTSTGKRKVLGGHSGSVRAVAISADGRRVVTSDGASARVFDAETAQEVFKLAGHAKSVASVAISADGSRIVTGSIDKIARVYDGATGTLALELPAQARPVTDLAVSADGNLIGVVAEDGIARIFNGQTGAEIHKISGHSDGVLSIAFSADGRRAVTGSADNTARVWDVGTWSELRILQGHEGAVYSTGITADGGTVVTSSHDQTVRLWDVERAGASIEVGSHFDAVYGVGIAANGERLVSFTNNETVGSKAWVWNVPDAQTRKQAAEKLPATETPLERAKRVAPTCLDIDERKVLILRPEPPEWCSTFGKSPYAGRSDRDIAIKYGNFAERALFNGDFPSALEAADLGLRFEKDLTWINVNRAHALMYLGRLDDSLAAYTEPSQRGITLSVNFGDVSWDEAVSMDFDKLTSLGLDHGFMKTVREALSKPLPAK
jgi:hypothetical protein